MPASYSTFFLPARSSAFGNHWAVLYFCNFVISRLVYKWIHTVWSRMNLRLVFLSQHDCLEIHPDCHMHQRIIPFYCWVVFYGMAVPQLVYQSTAWKTSRMFSSLVIMTKASVEQIYTGFCVNMSSFLWDKCPGLQLFYGSCMFSSLINCQTVSKVAASFCIPTPPAKRELPCFSTSSSVFTGFFKFLF